MKLKINILMLCLGSFFAHAGVRGVGMGGGYAEMQALFINSNLASMLQTCLRSTTLCGVDAIETNRLRAAGALSVSLTISEDCNPVLVRKIGPGQAQISSCALYKSENGIFHVKEFKEIAVLVFAAHEVYLGQSITDALPLGQKIFADYRQNEQAVEVSLDQGDFAVHILNTEMLKQASFLLSIEGLRNTLPIPASLLNNTLCEGPAQILRMSPLTGSSLENGYGLAEIKTEWSCGTGSFAGVLQIYFAVDAGEVKSDSIRLRISDKH